MSRYLPASKLSAPAMYEPVYRDFRAGDVRHPLAGISKAATSLGYQLTHRIGAALKMAMEWCVRHVSQ